MLELRELPGNVLAVRFSAMASPCELLLAPLARDLALELGSVVAAEALRIERKFSRYRDDSVVSWIHQQRGCRVRVDDETALLLDFAQHCFDISDGLFDVTSGPLRRAWRFDGSDQVPATEDVAKLLPLIGFRKLSWKSPWLELPPAMEIDFGGIGKEYAVDRAYDLMLARCPVPFLVNFGGDLRVSRPLPQGPWKVGIERPDSERRAVMMLEVEYGALATSGDSRRFLLKEGTRYGHILNPRTGWPVPDAPRSVTVAASSCTEAGLLSTLAMLKGRNAEEFLETQQVRCWVFR
ncbi:MAG: FAD:protein FMN transferase [Proteobacteria bacterium]|nr:FAD:protein FMN transferase [Pseudomonadota bacterium]